MKNFLFIIFFSLVFSSTYDVQIQLDNYQGIRQGSTSVSFNGENAGKVKRITENDDGTYTVILKIYDTFEINENMLFKVDNRKLVIDLDGMEKRKIRKEEERLAKIKAVEEEKARQLKIKEEALIAEEKEKARLKAEEEAKIAEAKAQEEKKARRLKTAADASPFKGDIEAIKKFQTDNDLQADGFWGAGSQKIYDRLEEEEMKTNQLKAQQEEIERQEKVAEQSRKKEKAKQAALQAEQSNKEYVEKKDKGEIKNDRDLLKQQYDTPPRLKRKLKINSKKYKDNWPVTLKFLITKKGYVEEISIKQSSGNAKFDVAAKKAVKKSKWHPAKKHDISVSAWHELEISF